MKKEEAKLKDRKAEINQGVAKAALVPQKPFDKELADIARRREQKRKLPPIADEDTQGAEENECVTYRFLKRHGFLKDEGVSETERNPG